MLKNLDKLPFPILVRDEALSIGELPPFTSYVQKVPIAEAEEDTNDRGP